MYDYKWPYPLEYDREEIINADVLVLGGGIAGCMAAIAAARAGQKVLLVEKGATKRSGAGGSGCDHWESAATNPCSKVTPEELTQAMLHDNDGFNNGISHYIECREGYDRLLDIEKMGGKIRDTEDEFVGAEFRDDGTKFMFAYDYENRFTLRIWGTTFKPAMYKELKRLGVNIVDRVMVTSLLTEDGIQGARCVGATGIHTRTGKFYIFNAKSSIICMSRPARIWLFSAELPGLCEFRPPQCIGDGHAMGWRAGAEFTMMEKSVRAEFSAAGRSYPPYGAGNNHNTWYAASIIDSRGKEIPYADRDGNILKDVKDRFRPAKGQKFFMKGGGIDFPKYEIEGPETLPFSKMIEEGYKLPFYADLTDLPEEERKVIWGMMVGQEGKTKVPIYQNYTRQGFDPSKHVLQCYGAGWTSASFLPQERQLFGLPGGFFNDWTLGTNIDGLYVAGDALYASDCYGHAAATGYYAGRHAAKYAKVNELKHWDKKQVEDEKRRVYAPLKNDSERGIGWKELNMAIAKTMQNYCGEIKYDDLLKVGLSRLKEYEENIIPQTFAYNPHELIRLLEVFDILTVSKIIIEASLARKISMKSLCFVRGDSIEDDSSKEKLIVIKQYDGKVVTREVPVNYFGDLKENYEKHNQDYI
ncbi:FAD-dependent oxidoreductase [Lutispora thermophila]|uniref:Succinate dehydrogenase/fumarate reductase, flavoprotein subunit n=1 Tax=Lutispora thermophila DSM 19022 TaxID=1122184 RepID=A0A1M6GCF2_9FIRM|nr:FAD-dependent oxidoreductase [Lutispora thermophila]SHJ07599.1 Succinate dehydrogenase/fumarate reductase, flavoprotein subunit [Lutispora thermophila DSM 19022]